MIQYLFDKLSTYGYKGVYKEREWSPITKLIKRFKWNENTPLDGVAIFYNSNKFMLTAQHKFVQQKEKVRI